jgi:5'-nucleotidase
MRILLTNDDGISSPGLESLYRTFSKQHEVSIIAPDSERSGTSQSITLKDSVRVKKISENRYICSGTPGDCVIVAYLGGLIEKPEIVISGINIGPNLGTDIIYSGTVAAARQAVIFGFPGIAVSQMNAAQIESFDLLAHFININLDIFLGLWNIDHFININSTDKISKNSKIDITSPSKRIYNDSLASFKSPTGEIYFFHNGPPVETEVEKGSDWDSVSQGHISVSPIFLHPVNHTEEKVYKNTHFRWDNNEG